MVDVAGLLKSLHPYEISVLKALKDKSTLKKLAEETKLQEVQVTRAFQWLGNKGLIEEEAIVSNFVTLGSNGEKYKKDGLPEIRFLKALTDEFVQVQIIERDSKLEKGELKYCF